MISSLSGDATLMDHLIFAAGNGDHITNVWDVLLQTAPILIAVATLVSVIRGHQVAKESVKTIKQDIAVNTDLTQQSKEASKEASEAATEAVSEVQRTVDTMNNHTKELARGVEAAKTTAAKITELERLLKEANAGL